MRLRSDFWISAHIRRCAVEGVVAVQRRRGAAEAGAIIIKLDRLDGMSALYGLAPQSETSRDMDRRFLRLHRDEWIESPDAEIRLKREIGFDSDLWILEIEDRAGRAFIELVD